MAVAIGTIVAWQTPATGYEVSMYAATPVPFWIGVSIGFLAAAVVTLESCHDRLAGLAVGLGWLTTVSIGSLPVIRSYRFYGRADPMTHLGWAAEMLAGNMRFGDVFYPGGHSTTVLLTDAIGVPVERGMLLFAALYFVLYALFIPLIVKALFDNNRMSVIAAFSGFTVLPINQIANGLFFHTYSMATFFFPVFLYVLVKHLKSSRRGDSIVHRVGRWNVLLSVLGVTLIFTHPQLALNVVILLGTLVVLHGLRKRLNLFLTDLRPVYGVFVLMTLCWVAWIFQFEMVFIVGERVLVSTSEVILGTGSAGESVEARYQSALSVEATVLELFVKLFLVPSVYLVLAFLTVVFSLWSQFTDSGLKGPSTDDDSLTRSVVIYFGYVGLVLGPFFLAHFLGPVSHLFFRHYGFAMVFALVLGAAMIHHIGELIPTGGWRQAARPVAVILLVVALALSLSTVFASPYIYNGSHHVSDQHMDGYETAIDYRAEDIQWNGIRNGPGREFDALVSGTVLYDRPDVSTGESTYGEEDLRLLLSGGTAEAQYLPVSQADVDREVIAYRELRYSAGSFESIGGYPGVHHVQDNGEFDLYYVTPRSSGDDPGQDEA
ncbi:hypothetical protein C468_16535 [Halorubrum kocurii JCM 14978]|uniref:Glycosyltransferase RgtA/B/C/D-like domain-containing protein n=2 Tax=Halorubrum kocurii TaxID=478441 RepID=M0NJM8_9EURY|nr:hypothetical protein C468_16535 [Halorubrum kocurii JCM 14978]